MRATRHSAEVAKPSDAAGRLDWVRGGDLGGVLGDSEVTFRSLDGGPKPGHEDLGIS
jgi:hypothetical protein